MCRFFLFSVSCRWILEICNLAFLFMMFVSGTFIEDGAQRENVRLHLIFMLFYLENDLRADSVYCWFRSRHPIQSLWGFFNTSLITVFTAQKTFKALVLDVLVSVNETVSCFNRKSVSDWKQSCGRSSDGKVTMKEVVFNLRVWLKDGNSLIFSEN